MSPGLQELIALAVVAAVIGFALYRRLRRKSAKAAACCDAGGDAQAEEKTIHFYRRNPDDH